VKNFKNSNLSFLWAFDRTPGEQKSEKIDSTVSTTVLARLNPVAMPRDLRGRAQPPLPRPEPWEREEKRKCNIPDFSKLKFSSCIHGILHFKVFSKVLNLILQRILFQMPFSPNFNYKRVSERKYFKISSIVMELSYIFL
jgi:hypothetical protein